MNLYKISQKENNTWDTYGSAIVAAETEAEARDITPVWDDEKPLKFSTLPSDQDDPLHYSVVNGWCDSPDKVIVELIGTAKPFTKAGVVLASFNAD